MNVCVHVCMCVMVWSRLIYWKMFGGATAFTRRQFEASNGYSNEYYGWGGEDDDMEKRLDNRSKLPWVNNNCKQ